MTKVHLLEEIKSDPARYYRAPSDVIRDRRFSDQERLQILEAWERDARALSIAGDEDVSGGEPSRIKTIVKVRMEAESKSGGSTK